MATSVRGNVEIQGLRNTLPFGPYPFFINDLYTQFLATEIQISALSSAQLVGGVSPTIAAITTINLLILHPDQQMRVGLHGVAAQASGFTLNAQGVYVTTDGSINALQVYNNTSSLMNLFIVLGQK